MRETAVVAASCDDGWQGSVAANPVAAVTALTRTCRRARNLSSIAMLIKAYGLFWRADDVWQEGVRGRRELLGRRGYQSTHLEVCNFWRQQGLYVLYDEYGPYYVGLVRSGTLGSRLHSHYSRDVHRGRWDRFSWFGFCAVLSARDERGMQMMKLRAERSVGASDDAIADMETLLIKSLGTKPNLRKGRFQAGVEWTQVRADDREDMLDRLARRRRRRRL